MNDLMGKYNLADYKFIVSDFFPQEVYEQITELRIDQQEAVIAHAKKRQQRKKLAPGGRLNILAADHPARNVTMTADNPLGIGNRYDYLGRILRVITDPEIDGLMATSDLIEDVFCVDYLYTLSGRNSFLDQKLLIASANRSGLNGYRYEMFDLTTSTTPEQVIELGLDGIKYLVRFDLADRDSIETMIYIAREMNKCIDLGLPIFLEPLPGRNLKDGGFELDKTAAALIKVAGIASAMGKTSFNTWLTLPYTEDYQQVALATTLPILMLGGNSQGNPIPILVDFAEGMKAGKNIRGTLLGRNVVFPGDDDPLAVALAVNKITHNDYSVGEALQYLSQQRGKEMDLLQALI